LLNSHILTCIGEICSFYNSNKIVAMASVCFCIVAAVFILSSILSPMQSYQQNDILYASQFDGHNWKMDDEVNVSVNLTTAVREVNSRFVSVTLDSSLVEHHWVHLDFRYDISCLWYGIFDVNTVHVFLFYISSTSANIHLYKNIIFRHLTYDKLCTFYVRQLC